MKKLISGGFLFVVALINLQAQTSAVQNNVPAPTAYEITTRDGNSQVWQRTEYETGPDGKVVPHLHQYTELATGLNHLVNGQWVASDETITILPDGTAAAANSQHQAYFPSDIYNGEIKLVTPDGKVLQSQPVGLSYDDGSNTVLIAVLTNSVGQLVSSNQIVYPNAFAGVNADLRYTYHKSGFEQDVVLHEQPPTPASLGLNPETAKIQVLTEFFNPPQPEETAEVGNQQTGLTDTTLAFGSMTMGRGKAFAIDRDSGSPGRTLKQLQVYKQWARVQGRNILIEQLPYQQMATSLETLPATAAVAGINPSKSIIGKLSKVHMLPSLRKYVKKDDHIRPAGADPLLKKGYVLDYIVLNTDEDDFTFQGDTTYYISGILSFDGNVTIEGGTILKYNTDPDEMVYINFNGTTTCATSPYRPAIFTSQNDDSVGESISNPDYPLYYYWGAIADSTRNNVWHNLSIKYGNYGIDCRVLKMYDCQFVNCMYPVVQDLVDGGSCDATNVLMVNAGSAFTGVGFSAVAYQCTVDNCTNLTMNWSGGYSSTLALTNSLLVNVQAAGVAIINSNYTAWVTDSGGQVLQTVGGGSCYLVTNSIYHNAGTTNVDPALLADLATKTTYPPIAYTNVTFSTVQTFPPQAQRDNTGNPDLGYHYDPLDYTFGGCTMSTNINFAAGTAVGWFRSSSGWYHAGQGIQLSGNINVAFNGTATAPDYWVRLNTVQENDQTAGYGHGSFESWASPPVPTVTGYFLHCTVMAGEQFNSYFADDYGTIQANMTHSELWGGALIPYGDYMSYTNCLIWRPTQLGVNNGDSSGVFIMRNCTMIGGEFSMNRNDSYGGGALPVSVRDCAFDGTVISTADTYGSDPSVTDYDYNSYTNTTDPFSIGGSHDVMVTNFNWQSSWFGNYYQPTNSPLINAGSTSANQMRLYEFTTQTNQSLEGTSPVDIGYHYVATDSDGNPLETLTNNLPDYINDANGDGLPDWWEYAYFGNLNQTATNTDGSGNTLLHDYQYGINPNVISFRVLVTNNYVDTTTPLLELNIGGGIPSYYAVSIDDTNYIADANWQAFAGTNLTINLGTHEGWHKVWIGLRGYADATTSAVWQCKRLKLDLTPPVLIITNPISSTIDVPMIQLQGYSLEALSSISYDLTNAAGTLTNQQVLVLNQYYDTNTFEFTTNTFQAFDVILTNGVNIFTVHATDLAGNVTTLVTNFTLDYSSKTNPPSVQINWPQPGTQISGNSFTINGQLHDATITVAATITDTNGDINTINGLVERSGRFWLENMPLNSGTNTVILTATDAAGNLASTNFYVVESTVTLAINPVSNTQQLWQSAVNLTGTISDTTYAIWVNGVKGHNNGDGTWSAINVPVDNGGTATFIAIGYAPSEQQPDGSYGN